MRVALGAGEVSASRRGDQAERGARAQCRSAGRKSGLRGRARRSQKARKEERRAQGVGEPAGPRRRDEAGAERAKPRLASAAQPPSASGCPVLRATGAVCVAADGKQGWAGGGEAPAFPSRGPGRWCLLVPTPRSARDAFLRTRREARGPGTRLSAPGACTSVPAAVTSWAGPRVSGRPERLRTDCKAVTRASLWSRSPLCPLHSLQCSAHNRSSK